MAYPYQARGAGARRYCELSKGRGAKRASRGAIDRRRVRDGVTSRREGLVARGEVTKRGGLVHHPIARQRRRVVRHRRDDLDDVVDVALGIGASRYREANQFHRRWLLAAIGLTTEHHGADLAAPNPTHFVEGDRERLAGILERRDVTEQGLRVEVDRVAADGLDDCLLYTSPSPRDR